MDIDFSQLRTFAAVLDEGTFDGAAAVLRITPSAVSQRIKALEQHVGRSCYAAPALCRPHRPVKWSCALRDRSRVWRTTPPTSSASQPTNAHS